MKFPVAALALLMRVAMGNAQTPISTLPYFYDWTNPAALAKQPDGITCVGGDGHWGCYIFENAPEYVVDATAGLVRNNVKNTPATLFIPVDATGKPFSGGEVFTFQASRSGPPGSTGTVQVYASATLIRIIDVSSLSTTMQSFSALLPVEVGNSLFTISIVVTTNSVISIDNTRLSGGALPITLASFTLGFAGESVMLEWSTLSEINNYGFYVQKSMDKTSWTDVENSFQPGYGTAVERHSYSYKDYSAPLGKYYRLRQVDLDGTNHFSEILSVVTAIEPELAVKEFALSQNYPNPFNPNTVISSQLPAASDVKIAVYDLLGREVAVLVNERRAAGSYRDLFSAEGRMPSGRQGTSSGGDARRLASGVYIYRLTAGDFVKTRTMVLTK